MAGLRPCLPLIFVVAVATLAEHRALADESTGPVSSIQKDRWHRPRWVWVNADAGYEMLSLRTFRADPDKLTADFAPSSGSGAAAGVGLGARIVFFTIGARARVGQFHDDAPMRTVGDWQLWSLDAEIGFRAPLGRVEPYLTVAGGYAIIGGFDDAVAGVKQGLDVSGAELRGGVGVDIFVHPMISLGVNVTAAGLFLARPGIPVRDLAAAKEVGTLNEAKARVLEADGSSAGWALTISGGPGFHF
jgi:hypothetical protein